MAENNSTVEILINDASQEAPQIDLASNTFKTLAVELVLFILFQARLIALYEEEGPVSATTSDIARYSEAPLLFMALIAILNEIRLRAMELYYADEHDRLPAKLGGVVAISKMLTVISFCVAYYSELRNSPSIYPDKVAGLSFVVLLAIEVLTSARLSVYFPSGGSKAVGFLIDIFLKTNLCTAANLQRYSSTELIGYCMAAVFFTLVLANLYRFAYYHDREPASNRVTPAIEETPLLSADIVAIDVASGAESNLPVAPTGSVNADGKQQQITLLSESKLTFLEGLQKTARNTIETACKIPAYVLGKPLSEPPRPC